MNIRENVVGCAEFSHELPPDTRNPQVRYSIPQATHELTGPWEYVDKTRSYTIIFDSECKGTYEWEKGRFETQSLKKGVWTGTGAQEENDREGGFEFTFSDDFPVAQGKWWYTRIESVEKSRQRRSRYFSMLT